MSLAVALGAGVARATDSSVPFIRADQVHAMGITGAGVTVAVIDTGIYYDHPGLLGSISDGGISFENGRPVFDGGTDIYEYGHGTYMSLIITDGRSHRNHRGGMAVAGRSGAQPCVWPGED